MAAVSALEKNTISKLKFRIKSSGGPQMEPESGVEVNAHEIKKATIGLAEAASIPFDKHTRFFCKIKSVIFEEKTGISIRFPPDFSLEQAFSAVKTAVDNPWKQRTIRRGSVITYLEDVYRNVTANSPVPLSLIREIDRDLYDNIYATYTGTGELPSNILYDTVDRTRTMRRHPLPPLKPNP